MLSRYSLATQRALFILLVLTLALTIIPATTLLAEPPSQSPTIYYVQWGDTLFSISMRFNTTVPALMAANGLTNYNIYAGQRLVIPPYSPPYTITPPAPPNYTCKYTVQYRDTIYSIAYRYKIPWQNLMAANYLYAPFIQPGQVLNVPCLIPEPAAFPTYTVKSGDNVFRIAIQYKTSIYAIALVNGLYSPNWIFAGQTLVIPYPNSVIWPVVPTVTPTSITNTPTPTVPPTATPPTQVSGVVVMSGNAFVPGSITILLSTGGTVLWKNTENVTHTVTSGAPGAIDNKFRSGQLGNGQSYGFTFTSAGTYPYFSETDTNMVGTIIVQ